MELWLVGQFIEENAQGIMWEFQGIFNSEDKAIKACKDEDYFIVPADMNKEIPKDTVYNWPGLKYPLRKDNG